LLPLLEWIKEEITDPSQLFLIRKYSSLWNVPRRVIYLGNDFKIKSSEWEEIDISMLKETRGRLATPSMKQTLETLVKFKIPFPKIVNLNTGN
jgi:hypothetical protein